MSDVGVIISNPISKSQTLSSLPRKSGKNHVSGSFSFSSKGGSRQLLWNSRGHPSHKRTSPLPPSCMSMRAIGNLPPRPRVSSRLVIISSSSDHLPLSSRRRPCFLSLRFLSWRQICCVPLAAFSIALSIAEATIFLPFPDSTITSSPSPGNFLSSILTKRNHSLSSFGSSLDGLPVDVSRALIAAETAKIPLSNLASKEVMSLGKISPFAEEMSPRLHPGLDWIPRNVT